MNVRARRAVRPCALSALLSWTLSLQAQHRFELVSRDGIAQMPDVGFDTFRDRRTASGLAVFSAGQNPSSAPPVGTAGWIVPRIVDAPQSARPLCDAPVSPDDRLRHIELRLQQIGSSRTFAVWPVSCDRAGNR